eukprot:TRINITY_DN10801_c0_g1_i1.p1 TRINITY_DN10801_c0_g1~~TRINITY_DN10801_c0_g1_i1.p1  ORF type:complete len:124 (+),score=15.22 TRINITY_DN10801_c0_g1_i1:325-696(+)
MCGGMSIAIEGAQQYPDVCFLNSDLSEDDLAIGADNIAQCNSTAIVGAVDGLVCSSVRVPFGDNSIDTIVTDMPWGKRCSSPKLNRKLYPKLLSGTLLRAHSCVACDRDNCPSVGSTLFGVLR